MVDFPEALCDFGSSVNIMPRNLYVRVGRPFLNTSGAVIYASTAKISFYIKGRKETFSFKNKITQISEQSRPEPRKRTNRRNRTKQMWTKSAKMVTAAQGGQDRQLKSHFLIKKDDPGVPSIECTINGYYFQKTLYDTGSDVNIMAAITYHLLHGTMPLKPTYIQLQMANQTFRKVIDMGEDEYDPPIILARQFLSTVKIIIYNGTREVHMHFPSEKVRRYFTDPNYIVEDSMQVRTRRRRRNRNQWREIIKDGWADYEGEVVRSEDIQL